MELSKETKEALILSLIGNNSPQVQSSEKSPFEIGKKYFIRTVTYHAIIQVSKITGLFLEFECDKYSWVADSGRFMEAINDGGLNEVEPVNVSGGINIGSIVDYFDWNHELPRNQK